MFTAFLAFISFNGAVELTNNGEYEASQKILNILQPTIKDYTKYCFYKGANAFCLNQKVEAEKWLGYVADNFQNDSKNVRYVHVAALMLSEVKNWKTGDIADVGRDMKISTDRLDTAKAGKQTQEVQERIVKKLDKLIKDQEDAQNGKGDGNGDPSDGKGNDSGSSQMPKSDSTPGGNGGKGTVTDKKLIKLAEEWGKMPPSERAKAIQEITRDLPPKFKPMIDDYYKGLNKLDK